MIRTQDTPRSTPRTRRIYTFTIFSAVKTIRGFIPTFHIRAMAAIAILIVVVLRLPGYSVRAATPTPGYTEHVDVIFHLLDANGQPLVGVTVNLVLNRYADTIEEVPYGSCMTDSSGSCSITIHDPPRLRSGQIEGFIDLGEKGRQLIGWKGERLEVILQLYPDGKLATAPAPLDAPYEGQTQQPTDAPWSTSTLTPKTSAAPIPTATASPMPEPPVSPAATVPVRSAVTLTPQQVHPSASISPTPVPSSGLHPRSGWIWVGVGLALLILLGTTLSMRRHRQHMHRKLFR